MRRLALAALLAAIGPAHAQMYKCVDERGVTHYSDKPSQGCKGGKVDIQASPPLSGTAAPRRPEDLARQDAEFKRRQLEREQAEAGDKKALEQRCGRLRQELAVLSGGTRVGRITPQGERIYMEDATRDARLAQLREQMRGCP
ncbi:MAG: DUF4124 domain-containing protein [Burkholderiales bacterium]